MILKILTKEYFNSTPAQPTGYRNLWTIYDHVSEARWGCTVRVKELPILSPEEMELGKLMAPLIFQNINPPQPELQSDCNLWKPDEDRAALIDFKHYGKPMRAAVCEVAYLCDDAGDTIEAIRP